MLIGGYGNRMLNGSNVLAILYELGGDMSEIEICSFCSDNAEKDCLFIKADGVVICEECVNLCVEIITAKKQEKLNKST